MRAQIRPEPGIFPSLQGTQEVSKGVFQHLIELYFIYSVDQTLSFVHVVDDNRDTKSVLTKYRKFKCDKWACL